MLKCILIFLICALANTMTFAQAVISSSNGWTATVTLAPIAVVPEFTNCPWYYHYEVRFECKVVFSGSNVGRSFSGNAYLNCSGGSGSTPYASLGTFTTNSTTNFITTNRARQYTAISNYNYGANPDCNQITLSNANCNTVRLDYWGNGVTSGSTTFSFSAPLPITLLHFNASYVNDYVILKWYTGSETNNDYFTIERSADGYSFDQVTKIKGAGNSNTTLDYSAVDKSPLPGITYYRLKQTDFDGEFEYSNLIAVSSKKVKGVINIYPNPVIDILAVNYISSDNSEGLITVSDDKGVLILSTSMEWLQGENKVEINTSNYAKGLYMITFYDAGNLYHKRFIKK